VAFVNEEEPSATIYTMGSMVYARRARAKQECIVAMLSLESIGYYNDSPNSQHYPKPFNWFYPNTGNFLAFVGNLASRSLVRRTITSFRQRAQFPSEGVAAPETYAPDISRSDHSSFWQHGYAAIMVTGTAPFRNPHYHQHSDTPGTLRFDALARVVSGMSAVIIDLAGND
jgi:Zn-dependent M28 family amino/carboxypeptidase